MSATDTRARPGAPAASAVWVLVPGTVMVGVTFGLARYGYGLLLPDVRAAVGMTAGAAGLIASLTYVSYLVANLLAVPITERWGSRATIGAAAGSAAVGMTLLASAGTVPVLAAGVLVAGAASGLALPPYADVVDREVEPHRRDAVWAAISSGTGWGVALAGPAAILAGDRWRLVWAAFALLAVVVGVVAVLAAPRRGGERVRRPQLSRSWFLCPRSRPLLLSAVLVGAGSAVWWTFGVDAMRTAGLDATLAGAVYAACGVASLLGVAAGRLFARWGLRGGYFAATGGLAVGLGLLALDRGSLAGVAVAAVVIGAAYNTVIAAQGVWSARVFAAHPAAGLAAVSTALTLGTLAGPAVAGVAVDRFGHAPTLAAAALVVLAATPFAPPTGRRREELDRHECRAAPVRD